MASLTISPLLTGIAAEQVARSIAISYAAAVFKSDRAFAKDEPRVVNAPWSQPFNGSAKTRPARHAKWLARVKAERTAYERALRSLLPDFPAPPVLEWRPYKAPDGKTYGAYYQGLKIHEAAQSYAAEVFAKLAGAA